MLRNSGKSAKPTNQVDSTERRLTAPSTLTRRSLAFGTGILASRLTGLVREILIARTLGTSAAASALVVAQLVPNLLRGLVGDEVAQGALATVLSDARKSGGLLLAWKVLRRFTIASSIIMGVLTLCMLPTASFIVEPIAPGLPATARKQAEVMVRLLSPIVATSGLAASGTAALLIQGRVGILAALNAMSNIPVIIWLLLVPYGAAESVAGFIALGLCLQGLLQFFLGARHIRTQAASSNRHSEWSRGEERRQLRRIGKLALPVALTMGAASLSGLIDTAFASLVGSDGPAALDKAFRLMLLPYGMLGLAVSVSVMPALFSASGSAFTAELRKALRLQIALVAPVACILWVAAEPIVRITFERGAFGDRSVQFTSSALQGMAFVLPALGLSALGTRAWTTRGLPWLPCVAGFVAMAANLGLDAILVGPLGLFGLALATALAHGSLGLYLLFRARVWVFNKTTTVACMRVILPSIISAVVLDRLSGSIHMLHSSAELQFLMLVAASILVFGSGVVILGRHEYRRTWNLLRDARDGH